MSTREDPWEKEGRTKTELDKRRTPVCTVQNEYVLMSNTSVSDFVLHLSRSKTSSIVEACQVEGAQRCKREWRRVKAGMRSRIENILLEKLSPCLQEDGRTPKLLSVSREVLVFLFS